MPGDDLRKIKKAASLGVDTICMDMEDAVAHNRKETARQTIADALQNMAFGASEKLARINAVNSPYWLEDLEAVVPARPDGIVIPKVAYSDQIHKVCNEIRRIEKQNALNEGSTCIIAIIESAWGIINLKEIASSTARLVALIFGADDFAVDIGATRTKEAWEVFYARSAVVTVASAFGLQAIDMVYIDYKDQDGLSKEAISGARMGFSGKQIIHPGQVEPVQQAFSPHDEEICHAQQVLKAFEANQEAGVGAFSIDGQMIDAPTAKIAARVIAQARAAGKIS